MARLFESEHITKYGFATAGDISRLHRMGITVPEQSLVDLVCYSREKHFEGIGLGDLSKIICGITLEKSAVTRMSFKKGTDWNALSKKQKIYACDDAYAVWLLSEEYEKVTPGRSLLNDGVTIITSEVEEMLHREGAPRLELKTENFTTLDHHEWESTIFEGLGLGDGDSGILHNDKVCGLVEFYLDPDEDFGLRAMITALASKRRVDCYYREQQSAIDELDQQVRIFLSPVEQNRQPGI